MLVPQFGITGGVATTVALNVNALLNARYLRRSIRAQSLVRMLARSVVASVVMAGVVLLAHPFAPGQSAVGVLGLVTLGGVVYAALMMTDPQVSELTRTMLLG